MRHNMNIAVTGGTHAQGRLRRGAWGRLRLAVPLNAHTAAPLD
jgi:hypothetical protein